CTITFVSPTAGRVTGHATATIQVGGLPLTVSTDGQNGNSADGVKTYVDANIQITPPTALNPVGTTHVLTAHVNVNPGSGFVDAPAGTPITFAIVSGSGSFVNGVNTCTTLGTSGSCTATITSDQTGTTVVRATTTVSVLGDSLLRTTADGKP